jgi:hypothetical protein
MTNIWEQSGQENIPKEDVVHDYFGILHNEELCDQVGNNWRGGILN